MDFSRFQNRYVLIIWTFSGDFLNLIYKFLEFININLHLELKNIDLFLKCMYPCVFLKLRYFIHSCLSFTLPLYQKKAFSKCKFKSMGSNLGFVTLAAGEIEY
jgi:hypothetical protein